MSASTYTANELEGARYKVENDHKLAQSFLGVPQTQMDKDVASNLFSDLTNQYLSKLDYIKSQEELMQNQRNILREKDTEKTTVAEEMRTNSDKEDKLKREITIQENYQRSLQAVANIIKSILFVACILVILGMLYPEKTKDIVSKIPILNKYL